MHRPAIVAFAPVNCIGGFFVERASFRLFLSSQKKKRDRFIIVSQNSIGLEGVVGGGGERVTYQTQIQNFACAVL
jgi:hypothetical protein